MADCVLQLVYYFYGDGNVLYFMETFEKTSDETNTITSFNRPTAK